MPGDLLLARGGLDSSRAGGGRAEAPVRSQGRGLCHDVPGEPEAATAFRETDVLGFLAEAGFELHAPILYVQQDIVVVKRSD
jgi:hypothetical protein